MKKLPGKIIRRLRQVRHRFFTWFAAQLSEAQTTGRGAKSARLGSGAVLGPEGIIENIRGGRDHVVIGANSFVRGRLITYGHGGCISIGDWCYIGVRTEIWSMDKITIGNRVLIAHDVNIMDGSAHSKDAGERHAHFQAILKTGHPIQSDELPGTTSAPIVIEDDVWISFGVTILQGVRIGAGSIIAAGSLVTHDVPPGMLYRCEVKPIITPLAGDDSVIS